MAACWLWRCDGIVVLARRSWAASGEIREVEVLTACMSRGEVSHGHALSLLQEMPTDARRGVNQLTYLMLQHPADSLVLPIGSSGVLAGWNVIPR